MYLYAYRTGRILSFRTRNAATALQNIKQDNNTLLYVCLFSGILRSPTTQGWSGKELQDSCLEPYNVA